MHGYIDHDQEQPIRMLLAFYVCKVTHFILNNQIFQMIFILSEIIVRYRKLNGDFFAAMNIFLYLCPQI